MLTGWVGMSPNLEKSFAHLCTRLHMPGHFLHMPGHPQTCLYMPEHARTAAESPSPKRKREGPNTFPRLRFGLVSHAADGPFLTACGIARQIMESRIQLAQFEAASAAFSAKRY